jgi:competence protein ComEC
MKRRYFLLAILTVAVLLRVHFGVPTPSNSDISHQIQLKPRWVEVTGTVANRPKLGKTKRGKPRLTFVLKAERLDRQRVTGQVWLRSTLAPGVKTPEAEDRVTVTAKLKTPTNYPKSDFDLKTFLQRRGIFTVASGRIQSVQRQPKNPITRLQQYLYRVQSRWLAPDVAALQLAMVIGDRALSLPQSLEDSFRRVGMTHVMVVSGFQIVLILSVVSSYCQNLKNWQTFTVLLLVSAAFLALTGIQPSIARATVMALLPYLVKCFRLQLKPIETVLWAGGLLLLVAPLWLYELGFQLSFLATLGLVTSTDWLLARLKRLPKKLAEAIATPVVAMVWVQPLILTTFGTFPTYGLIANILCAPLVEAITIGGFLTTLVSLIPLLAPMASALGWLLSFPTQLLVWLVCLFAQAPGATLNLSLPPCLTGFIYFSFIAVLLLNRRKRKPAFLRLKNL